MSRRPPRSTRPDTRFPYTTLFRSMLAAVLLGGVFILTTYHLYWAALASGVGALAAILWWVWTGTGIIPEKPEKAVGHGLALPLYAYGDRKSTRLNSSH